MIRCLFLSLVVISLPTTITAQDNISVRQEVGRRVGQPCATLPETISQRETGLSVEPDLRRIRNDFAQSGAVRLRVCVQRKMANRATTSG